VEGAASIVEDGINLIIYYIWKKNEAIYTFGDLPLLNYRAPRDKISANRVQSAVLVVNLIVCIISVANSMFSSTHATFFVMRSNTTHGDGSSVVRTGGATPSAEDLLLSTEVGEMVAAAFLPSANSVADIFCFR